MKVLDCEFVKEFCALAEKGWQHGFHERNGGNLSYRIPDGALNGVEELDFNAPFYDIGTEVPDLAGEAFFVTGSGKYFEDVLPHTAESCGIILVDNTGSKYQILWGLLNDARPTSELPSHLMNHQVKKRVTGGKHRVIYHCHPENLIALTFLLPLTDKAFTRELWEMMTECPVIFPEGVGVIPWMVPGGRDIAVATSEKMKDYNLAVWAHHGLFCSGETFSETFALAHTVEKSASIAIKVRAAGGKRQTITKEDFLALAKDFNIDLNLAFLED